MKCYLDEDLNQTIAEILKHQGIDAVSVYKIGMKRASDLQQLEYAAFHKRCLVTRNRNHFINLTTQFFNEQRPHCGVLVVPYTLPVDNYSVIAKLIAKHALRYPHGMSAYQIDYLKK